MLLCTSLSKFDCDIADSPAKPERTCIAATFRRYGGSEIPELFWCTVRLPSIELQELTGKNPDGLDAGISDDVNLVLIDDATEKPELNGLANDDL